MATVQTRTKRTSAKLTPLEKKIACLAKEGRVHEYVQAVLEHPELGRLMRTLAQEENAPEHHEFMQRVHS